MREDDGQSTTQDLVAAPHERAHTSPLPVVGSDRDRYSVLEQVGAGGMGVVHRAYDSKLRREVALKMLKFDRRPHDARAERAEQRILREAQTMAQLSHPNVLPVYDVEPVGELVYIAMEYVDGETLGQWLRRKSHPWREVVELFRQAGQGLHAAHQAGIVHRDFKPANVLLGNNGRVLVTDFGLARAGPQDDDRLEASGPATRITLEVTEEGEVVGTPAYMAPEQLRGESVDARADQYAFCVALYEGLYGRRPFPQRELRELQLAKEARQLDSDAAAGVPGWLFRIVQRGMHPDAAQRFPDMAALLEALGHDPAQALRRWLWVGSGAVLGAAAIGLRLAADPAGPGCPNADTLMAEVWDDAARDRVRTALVATAQSYAADMAARVTERLETHARGWAEAHVQACAATRVRGEQSEEAFDLRMACLRRQRAELETTVEVLSERVSVATLRGAAGLVAALPAPEACADVEALLARRHATDPAHASELESLRAELSRASTLVRAGRLADARTLVDQVEARSTSLHDPILHGEALAVRGRLAKDERDLPAAERWLAEAHALAVEGRDAALAIETATDLVDVVGTQLARPAEAELWARQAHAWLRGVDEADPRYTRLLLNEGNVNHVAGRLEEARAAFTEAVERMEALASSGDLAEAHHDLGLAFMSLGKPAEAGQHFARELELREATLGRGHPDVGAAHQRLGAALYHSGELGPALPHLEQAVQIFEASLGPMHPRVAASLGNLGALRDDLGEPDEAREHFERALHILESAEGTGSTELVAMLGNLAQALRHMGQPAAAAPHLRRAAALIESTHGRGHPERVDLLAHLGETLLEAGELAAARDVLTEADALRRELPPEAAIVSADTARAVAHLHSREREPLRALPRLSEAVELYTALGPELDSRRGETLLELGEVLLDADDPAAAHRTLETAQPLLTTPKLPATTLARARFALARALMADAPTPASRDRARQLAEDARMGFDEGDPRRAEVTAWLDALER